MFYPLQQSPWSFLLWTIIAVASVAVASGFYLEDGSGPITWDQFPVQEEEFERPGPEAFVQIDPKDYLEWIMFKKTYNKTYKDEWEDALRRSNWADNVKFVNKHNEEFLLGEHTFWVAVQEHSDMSEEEFMATMTGDIPDDKDDEDGAAEWYSADMEEVNLNLPSTVDWTRRGYVTPVKSQGRCGSCWAFAAVGAIEGQTKRKLGVLRSLSEQNVIDCATKRYGDNGCKGGRKNSVFTYVRDQGGIDGSCCYPYEARQRACRYRDSCKRSYDRGYRRVRKSERSLKTVIAIVGPAAISVDVRSSQFRHYRGGVFNNPSCSSRRHNHAMLCVGYGSQRWEEYWKVKNSWGSRWGDQGYIKMSRNRGNQCGIANWASYPVL